MSILKIPTLPARTSVPFESKSHVTAFHGVLHSILMHKRRTTQTVICVPVFRTPQQQLEGASGKHLHYSCLILKVNRKLSAVAVLRSLNGGAVILARFFTSCPSKTTAQPQQALQRLHLCSTDSTISSVTLINASFSFYSNPTAAVFSGFQLVNSTKEGGAEIQL